MQVPASHWLLLILLSPCVAPVASAEDRFEVLFNGEDLTGWKGLDQFWSVANGAIVGQTTEETPTKSNTFLIWQGGEVGDFEFRGKVRFEGNNSGVQYRSEIVDGDNFALKGYQADLHPKASYFGMMYGEKTGRGIIAQRGQKIEVGADGKTNVVGKVGDGTELVDSEWNDLTIIAVGNRLIHQVNGVTTVDITDDHPDAASVGSLGLQLHQGPPMKVEFRNLMLRKLNASEGAKRIAEATKNSPANASTTKPAAEPDSFAWISARPKANWIWSQSTSNGQQVFIRSTFKAKAQMKSAKLYSTCDNKLELFVNGKSVGTSPDWPKPIQKDVQSQLVVGTNVIAADCRNAGGIAAFVCKLVIEYSDGSTQTVVSNTSWKVNDAAVKGWKSANFDAAKWPATKKVGVLGAKPWGIPNGKGSTTPDSDKPLDIASILTPPGFVIERVHSVTPEQGSWVALTTDPQGRIYASDQGQAGLFRLTLRDDEAPLVERVDAGQTKALSGAQGLVWAFDSLWFHKSGGHLMRVTDTDGDDKLDTVVEFPGGTGGGEHGNHAVIAAADAKHLLLDGGNHAALGDYTQSRVPTWNEGLLLPRMWDANGHARGRMAPGGWVAVVDPETKEQVLHGIGFRNQYDICLNRFGDIFTYDADMEWDMGLPWYRPTRICQVASGADFGWRSGSGKWPTYYEDSLPPTVEIGPGSPTGMVAGLGADFPTRYQDAVFGLDWTFGTIYAIHLDQVGAGYTGTAEPFVVGSPLGVTDAIVGQDGAMYFTVGGRGTSSELLRVRYVGDESRDEPTFINEDAAKARTIRHTLEAFHGVVDAAVVATAWPHLATEDRFLRHAARVAIESQPVATWIDRTLSETNPQSAVTSAVALARMGDHSHQASLLAHLLELDAASLTEGQMLGLLRAYSLTFINLGKPTADQRADVIAELDPLFPNESGRVNVELARLLVYLRAESVVPKTLALIEERKPVELPDWTDLASRNARYGGSVNRMLNNHPPTRELMYAFMLRTVKNGWTLDQRRAYFTFLNDAANASGGSSYGGFLTRIRDEALSTCDDPTRKALEDITGEDFDPKPDFPIAEIEGPGKEWTLSEAAGAARGKPNFERGRSLYFSAKCASCHRLGGLGGNIGPDLTSARSKFQDAYVVEAVINPSKDISDQYGSSLVVLEDGRIIDGLAIEGENEVTIYSNKPDEAPLVVNIDEIIEMTPSKISQMPAGLFNKLNAKEIRDLVAYVLSAGDPSDKRYRK